ncbi:hypothetical protein ACIHCQ_32335 [Streptomyces sp. NPDC052236]
MRTSSGTSDRARSAIRHALDDNPVISIQTPDESPSRAAVPMSPSC